VRLLGLALSALEVTPEVPAWKPTAADTGTRAAFARMDEPPAQYDLKF